MFLEMSQHNFKSLFIYLLAACWALFGTWTGIPNVWEGRYSTVLSVKFSPSSVHTGLFPVKKKGNGHVSCSPWADKSLVDRRYIQEGASEASYAGLEAGHRHFRDEWSFSACGFETGDDGYPCLSLTCQRKESFTDSKAHFSAHSQYMITLDSNA